MDDGSSLSERLNFKHYNATNDRLPDLSLSSIEDQEGNIWIVSENKISKFDAGLNLLEEYKDQIQMAETRPVCYLLVNCFLGSLYGALCIIPDELHKSDFVPPIVFFPILTFIRIILLAGRTYIVTMRLSTCSRMNVISL